VEHKNYLTFSKLAEDYEQLRRKLNNSYAPQGTPQAIKRADGTFMPPLTTEQYIQQMMQISRLQNDCSTNLNFSKEALNVIQRNCALEARNEDIIAAWMAQLKTLIWPKTEDEIQKGLPVLVKSAVPMGFHEITRGMHQDLRVLDDVKEVINCFRSCGWLYRALWALRGSPTCGMLHRLTEGAHAGDTSPEIRTKLVAHLQAILGKARLWKSKARRYLMHTFGKTSGPMKRSRALVPSDASSSSTHQRRVNQRIGYRKVESAKLIQLVNEANILPVSSGLKTVLREQLEEARNNDVHFSHL
jgi:hypothetical protein